MFYTAQELLAQIKGWEYIIAILFLGLFILYWQALAHEVRRRQHQPARVLSRPQRVSYPPGGEGAPSPNTGRQAPSCWEVRQCPQGLKERCPAYALKPVPCWLSRSLVSGKVLSICDTCPVYTEDVQRLSQAASQRQSGAWPPGGETDR